MWLITFFMSRWRELILPLLLAALVIVPWFLYYGVLQHLKASTATIKQLNSTTQELRVKVTSAESERDAAKRNVSQLVSGLRELTDASKALAHKNNEQYAQQDSQIKQILEKQYSNKAVAPTADNCVNSTRDTLTHMLTLNADYVGGKQ